MMRELAEFERYIRFFAVTGRDLEERAFGRDAQCRITVAEDAATGDPVGYAVTVLTPFTYDLKPTVTLKELYVREQARGRGTGQALFRAVAAEALEAGAGRLKWDVLAGNRRAEAFYRALGARRVRKWIPYAMDERALEALSFRPPEPAEGKPSSR